MIESNTSVSAVGMCVTPVICSPLKYILKLVEIDQMNVGFLDVDLWISSIQLPTGEINGRNNSPKNEDPSVSCRN